MRIQRRSHHRPQPTHGRGCLSFTVTFGVLLLAGVIFQRAAPVFWQQFGLEEREVTLQELKTLYQRGDLPKTIQYAQQLIDQQPDHLDAIVLLARSYIYDSYRDYDQQYSRVRALQATTAALQVHPLDLELQGMHALALQVNGDRIMAERTARRTLHQGENVNARLALALVYASEGAFERGLVEAQQALQDAQASADPLARVDAWRVLAILESDLGRYEQAIATINQAIAQHPKLIPLYFERALYAMHLGDTDMATASYFNVIAFDENNAKARLRLCEVSSLLREREAAIAYCEGVTARAPGWSDAWYFLGREYYLQGDYRAAQQALHRCTTLQVAQNVPIEERRFACWYIQGQAAQVLGDCPNLLALYGEFQAMMERVDREETWVYPPGGPPMCQATPTPLSLGPSAPSVDAAS